MIRPSAFVRFATMLFTLLFAISPLFAQTATEFNDKDKKKLGEIAQRPEVIHRDSGYVGCAPAGGHGVCV